jgi:AcrR family transcriptional regulator
MREIAAELGMHAGNLYYYFDSKQNLLAFCQEDALGGLLELAEAVERAVLAPPQQLYLLAVGHVLLLNEGTPGSLAHLEVEALAEPYREAIIAKRNAYEQAVRRLIEAGVAAASLRPVDPRVAAMALLGALNWTVKWYRPDGAKSARQIGAELAEQLVRGLLPEGASFIPPPLSALPAIAPPADPSPAP